MPFFAKSKGKIIHSNSVEMNEEDKGTYTCVDCDENMIFIKEGKKSSHFRHLKDTLCAGGESNQHKTAKSLIVDYFDKWKFDARCKCGNSVDVILSGIPILEQVYKNRRLDVGILSTEKVVGAIEVHYSHLVEEEKERDLSDIDWVEIEANDVINGFVGNDFNLNTINASECISCKDWRKESDKIFTESNGNNKLVRKAIWRDNFRIIHTREAFIETIIKSKNTFYSNIQKISPHIIAFVAEKNFGVHSDTCKKLLFGRCFKCGLSIKDGILFSERMICSKCMRK